MERLLRYIPYFREPDAPADAETEDRFIRDLTESGLADDGWKEVLRLYGIASLQMTDDTFRKTMASGTDLRELGALLLMDCRYLQMVEHKPLRPEGRDFLRCLERLQAVLEDRRTVSALSISTENFRAYGQETDLREYVRVSADGMLIQRRARQGDEMPFYEEHFLCDPQEVADFFRRLTREFFIQSFRPDYRPYGQNGRFWQAHFHFRESHGIVVQGSSVLPPHGEDIKAAFCALAPFRYEPWAF